VTDTHTQIDRQTHDDSIYHAIVASRGKKIAFCCFNCHQVYVNFVDMLAKLHVRRIPKLRETDMNIESYPLKLDIELRLSRYFSLYITFSA